MMRYSQKSTYFPNLLTAWINGDVEHLCRLCNTNSFANLTINKIFNN